MNLKNLTNEELCVLVQSGEDWIIDELLRFNKGLFRKIVYSVMFDFNTYGIMGIDEDDLFQEAQVKAYELIYKFNADKNIKFSTFIYQPIRNHLIDFIRSKEPKIHMDNSVQLSDDSIQFSMELYIKSPEELYLKQETYEALYVAMEEIPLRNSRYLEYRFGFDAYDERSKKETAKHFHLSLSRAERLEKMSLSMMREKLL